MNGSGQAAPVRRLFIIGEGEDDSWLRQIPGAAILFETEYLTGAAVAAEGELQIVNLSRSLEYQELGYYVSLLAAARGHAPLPSAATLLHMASAAALGAAGAELAELLSESLAKVATDRFELLCYLGQAAAAEHAALAAALFARFPLPLLRAEFIRPLGTGSFSLHRVSALAPAEVPAAHRELAVATLRAGLPPCVERRKPLPPASTARAGCRVAILVNRDEAEPPSNPRAIEEFLNAAAELGIQAEVIAAHDAGRLSEFDALFIRETTALRNHTYELARRAADLGLYVVDDPNSILYCCNKIFTAELLARHGIATPRTFAVHRRNAAAVLAELGLPCVLKQPEGWSSRGMVLARTEQEFSDGLDRLLEHRALLVAQEFVPSGFDWRIGVFGGEPIYASKYYMVPDHWQVVLRHSDGMRLAEGPDEPVALENVPPAILQLATRAAALFGDGLYGVDLKELDGRSLVIEVNDNPSVDAGVEDTLLKDKLYRRIMQGFAARVSALRSQRSELQASPFSALIRRATPDDLSALVKLEEVFPSDRISRRSFARLFLRQSAEIWVCADGPQILGSLVLLFRAGSAVGRLYSIVVRADARRRGLASSLLALSDERCRTRGCRTIRLEVRAGDLRVRRLYHSRGYTVSETLPAYYADGAPALRMEKSLSAGP